MSWVRSDDKQRHHGKFLNVTIAEYGFFEAAKGWVAEHETDGFLPVSALKNVYPQNVSFRKAVRFAAKLATCNDPSRPDSSPLFETVEGGWKIHDYLEYNPSHAELEAERAKTLGRVRRFRERNGRFGNAVTLPVTDPPCNAVTNADVTPAPAPTRPLPDRKQQERKKQQRVVLTDDQFIAALRENAGYTHLNVDQELAKMDAWLAVHPGRQKTRRFIVGWLNRQDKPLTNGVALLSPKTAGNVAAAHAFVEAMRDEHRH